MPPVLQYMIIAGAGAAAIATIVATVGPQWQRIIRLASGQVEVSLPSAERWRRVHLEADARAPFHKIRAATPRRGLFGRGRR